MLIYSCVEPCLLFGGTSLSDDVVLALKLHRCLLQDGRPRELKPASAETWFIQTDACYDVDVKGVTSGIGAVLFSPAGKPVHYLTFHTGCQMRCRQHSTRLAKQTANIECFVLRVLALG